MTTDPVKPYAGFDPDQLADHTRHQADTLRAWLNGYLCGLASAAALVIAVWILW